MKSGAIAATVSILDERLQAGATAQRAAKEKSYLKSDLSFYGQPAAAINAVARDFLQNEPELSREQLIEVANALWAEPVFERRRLAIRLLEARENLLVDRDLAWLERLLREAETWALIDPLAVHVAGPALERSSDSGAVLERWASDEDFWIRRSALLVHLKALRAGGGDFERFGGYADSMLEEKEFFIRKAIGWVLRDTSRKRPELVYGWIAPRAHRASGVTVREAVKRLDEKARERVLSAYRQKRPL